MPENQEVPLVGFRGGQQERAFESASSALLLILYRKKN